MSAAFWGAALGRYIWMVIRTGIAVIRQSVSDITNGENKTVPMF